VQTDLGPVEVKTPRDRDGSFEPQILPKRQTRLAGLDDKVLGLYAGGMTVRDISGHLSELYGTEIGRDTISRITDAVLEDVAAWRTRPLEQVCPIGTTTKKRWLRLLLLDECSTLPGPTRGPFGHRLGRDATPATGAGDSARDDCRAYAVPDGVQATRWTHELEA
jgi:mutator family transposase